MSLLILSTALERPAEAQEADQASDSELPIVIDVKFSGDRVFSKEALRARIRTSANREFMGIPGFRWWLWMYRAGGALKSIGEPPAYLDSTVVMRDSERLELFYHQEGYRDAAVESRVSITEDGKKARVEFVVAPGRPTFIRDVRFEGLDRLPEDEQRELADRSVILHEGGELADPLGFRASGERYSEAKLLSERRRILTYLLEKGYAIVNRDSVRAIVYPLAADSFDISFRISPGTRYRFGSVHVDAVGPQPESEERTSSTSIESEAVDDSLVVTTSISGDSRLKSGLFRRSLQFRPGDWYSQSRLEATKRRIEATGVFSFSSLRPEWPDTVRLQDAAAVPHRIEVRSRRRHMLRFETFVLERGVLFGGSDVELGMGLGATYRNANLLGSGEAFQLRGAGTIAANSDLKFLKSAQGEIVASLQIPHLVFPFRTVDRRGRFYDVSTRLSLSFLAAKRDELKLIIRGRGGLRLRYQLRHSLRLTSLVDLLDFTISNPDTLQGFTEETLNPILESTGDDPFLQARIVVDYTQPQVNNAVRYTLRWADFDPLQRSDGFSNEVSGEIGGNLPALLDEFVFTPGVIEGTIPGFRSSTRLLYRPYVRVVGDFRRYIPVESDVVFAWKAIVGFAHPTGWSNTVPFDKRFFSGGAVSVRGWTLGQLGPGAVSLTTATGAGATNILGGDIRLEASAELRVTFLHRVFAADWVLTPFIDVGNVWFGPRNPGFEALEEGDPDGKFRLRTLTKEVAVGTGIGLRLVWEYFIARLDFAYRAYDPARPERGLFPDTGSQVHFGLGHTF